MSINIGPPAIEELRPRIVVVGVGDAGGNLSGDARGGNDILTVTGGTLINRNFLFGDTGNDMFDDARGGNDVLSASGTGNVLRGDAGDEMRDNARGGNDRLSASGDFNELYGDSGGFAYCRSESRERRRDHSLAGGFARKVVTGSFQARMAELVDAHV